MPNSSISSFPKNLKKHITSDGYDWLVGAIDPFHDFERNIEGGPDHLASKSYTRRYNQSMVVTAVNDDDTIAIDFHGLHGVNAGYRTWGTTRQPGGTPTVATHTLYPVEVFQAVAGADPTAADYLAGTCTRIGTFATTQSPSVPSRIISLGLEVEDITPSLYKKGAVFATHVNGEVEDWENSFSDSSTPANIVVPMAAAKPFLPITTAQMAQLPGTYIGKCRDGVYIAARLAELQPPRRHLVDLTAGVSYGAYGKKSVLGYARTDGSVALLNPCAYVGATGSVGEYLTSPFLSDSGFQPFRVQFSGLSVETTLQITLKVTVEYFPQPNHLFECGLATFSPSYDPYAFLAYHAMVRTLPYAVPVGFNAHGDWWRMVVAAASRAAASLARSLPSVLEGGSAAATALGQPEIAALLKAGSAVARMRQDRNKKATSKSTRR